MNKVLVLLFSAYLASQIESSVIQAPRGIADEAKEQVGELGSIVQGVILTAHDDLGNLETDFLTTSDNTLNVGIVSIQQEAESISRQLTLIKYYAQDVRVDITPCTQNKEDVLNGYPEDFNTEMRTCIFDLNRQEADLVTDAKYIVDTAYSKVQNLEFQINRCGEDILCISPLMSEIQLNKIRLPQNIMSEVDALGVFLTSLGVSVQDCSDDKITNYLSTATILLEEITECAYNMMGPG